MPLFTIESTYRLPIYRHRTYEAASLSEACRLAVEDEDWEQETRDYESAGETYVTGAWEGRDCAYSGPALPVPSHFDETVQRKAAHFEILLGLVKVLRGAGDAKHSAFWIGRAASASRRQRPSSPARATQTRMRRRRGRTCCSCSPRARCAQRSTRLSPATRPSPRSRPTRTARPTFISHAPLS
jgi:hypothetical protein